MDVIRQWAFALCAAAVAGSLAQMLLPEGNLQKVFKLTFSVFFLCCLFSPLLLEFRWPSAVEFPAEEETARLAGEMREELARQTAESFCRGLEELTAEEVARAGVAGAQISADVNTDGQGGISISKLEIFLPAEYAGHEERIAQRVREAVGFAPDVRAAENGG